MAGAGGDWLVVEELFERGDPAFVDALRACDDAEALGRFAPRWLADGRRWAREALFEYLDRPLNAFRHEALVKRLFKRAEAAGDDALMGRFLVAFDRSVRRVMKMRTHPESRSFRTEREANALAAAWKNLGLQKVSVWKNWQGMYFVVGLWREPWVKTPANTMLPRGRPRSVHGFDPKTRRYRSFTVPDWAAVLGLDPASSEKNGAALPPEARVKLARRRLYSIATRRYLRRRAWRYFRRLGRHHPERYIPAVAGLLPAYRDEDVADGLALLDNWGLIHILFRHSPLLTRDDRSWRVAPGQTLAALEPAPAFEGLWTAAPRATLDLLLNPEVCRPVHQWALRLVGRDPAAVAGLLSVDERLDLLRHDDPETVALAETLLRNEAKLAGLPIDRWIALVTERASPAALDLAVGLMGRWASADRATLAQALRLAMARPLPVAQLGRRWLDAKAPATADECRSLLDLAEAGSEVVRPQLVRWAAGVLGASAHFEPGWALAWLDSRHEDVRAEAWAWFQADARLRDDVTLWQRLVETPYDDVRLALSTALEARARAVDGGRAVAGALDLDAERLRTLWAAVLLNVNRGGRAKPGVLRQVVARLDAHPDEAPALLPLLAVALRSHRGPEWRAGLAALVRLSGRNEAAVALVRTAFPELRWVD